jgi:hypothetical protein
MATLIDSLIISLSLDPSNFTKGSRRDLCEDKGRD